MYMKNIGSTPPRDITAFFAVYAINIYILILLLPSGLAGFVHPGLNPPV